MNIPIEPPKRLIESRVNHSCCSGKTPGHSVEKEVQEVFMVVKAHAISNPGAVMIHTHDTGVADRAVMGSWGSNVLALEAITPLHELPGPSRKLF